MLLESSAARRFRRLGSLGYFLMEAGLFPTKSVGDDYEFALFFKGDLPRLDRLSDALHRYVIDLAYERSGILAASFHIKLIGELREMGMTDQGLWRLHAGAGDGGSRCRGDEEAGGDVSLFAEFAGVKLWTVDAAIRVAAVIKLWAVIWIKAARKASRSLVAAASSD